MSDRRELSRDKGRKLLEHIAVFSADVLGDFLDRVSELEMRVDGASRLIELYFTVNSEEKPLTREMIEACNQFRRSEYARFVRLVIEGYEWDEEGVMAVISAFVGDGLFSRMNLGERKVTVYAQDKDISKICDHVNVINRALSFIFQDRGSVELHLHQEAKKPDEKVSEKKAEAASSSKVPFGGKEGEYCCFKLEKRVDHGGNRKYKVGFSNLQNFYWLSIANRKGNEAEADELFEKLRVDG